MKIKLTDLLKEEETTFVTTRQGVTKVLNASDKDLETLKKDSNIQGIESSSGKKLKEDAKENPPDEPVKQVNGMSIQETKLIAVSIKKVLEEVIRSLGSGIKSILITDIEPRDFTIEVTYEENEKSEPFNFIVDLNNKLHLVDFDKDSILGEIGLKPSGEPIINTIQIKDELTKLFRSEYLQEYFNLNNLRDLVFETYRELLQEEESAILPTGGEEILGKFPTLRKVIVNLFTVQYNSFITDVQWVSPKPTTFRVVLKNGESFFLKWMGKGFEAQVSGKRYYLPNLSEYQQALDKLNELLRYAAIGTGKQGEQGGSDSDSPDFEGGTTGGDFPGDEGGSDFGDDIEGDSEGDVDFEEPESGEEAEVDFEEPGEEPESLSEVEKRNKDRNTSSDSELSLRHIAQINRRNTITKVKPSGKLYKRNKKVVSRDDKE